MDKSEVLINFFKFLHEYNITYVVLGDASKLPENIDGDVDFSISMTQYEIINIINKFCQLYYIKLVQVIQHEYTASCYVIKCTNLTNDNFIDIDICNDFHRNNRRYLSSDKLISSNYKCINGFFVPEVSVAFIYYFLKRFGKNDVKEKHLVYMKEQLLKEPEKCKQQLQYYFNNVDCKPIIELFTTNNYPTLMNKQNYIRNILHKSKSTQPSLLDRINEIYRKIKRVFYPTGLHIVVLGMDGSGKSSVIEKSLPELASAFRGIEVEHLRPHLGCIKSTDSKPVIDPHANPTRNFLMTMIKLMYFWYDYTFGYFLTIRPKLIRSNLVVYDRYFHDLLVDPIRYRFGAPIFLAKFIINLIPQPDLIILLNVSAETAQSRKQEVSFDESARQAVAYNELVGSMKNGVIIDANQSLEKVCENLQDVVVDFLAIRTQSRYSG